MLKRLIACMCITLSSTVAMASGIEQIETDSVDTTDANFASLHYFAGDWRCVDASESNSGTNSLTVLHIYGTLKHWYAIEALSFGPTKSEATSYMTYNAHKQAFVEFGLCDHGGYGKGKAPGWVNNSLTFTGYTHFLDREGLHWRKVLTKVDDNHFGFVWETSADGQVFHIEHQAICSK